MPTPVIDKLDARIEVVAETHSCPYAQRLGAGGLTLAEFTELIGQLEDMHADGECPPTHSNNSPTETWADWVELTKR